MINGQSIVVRKGDEKAAGKVVKIEEDALMVSGIVDRRTSHHNDRLLANYLPDAHRPAEPGMPCIGDALFMTGSSTVRFLTWGCTTRFALMHRWDIVRLLRRCSCRR